MGNNSVVFRFDDVEVRERELTITKAGEVLPVEPKAFRVLLFLLHNPQKLITKEELLDAVWADAAVRKSRRTADLAANRLPRLVRSHRTNHSDGSSSRSGW